MSKCVKFCTGKFKTDFRSIMLGCRR